MKTNNQLQFTISSLTGFEANQKNVTIAHAGHTITGKVTLTEKNYFMLNTGKRIIPFRYEDINIVWSD